VTLPLLRFFLHARDTASFMSLPAFSWPVPFKILPTFSWHCPFNIHPACVRKSITCVKCSVWQRLKKEFFLHMRETVPLRFMCSNIDTSCQMLCLAKPKKSTWAQVFDICCTVSPQSTVYGFSTCPTFPLVVGGCLYKRIFFFINYISGKENISFLI
jgi:hypothetical protein